eukprot:jgi/Picre1/35728/NNA_003188.t1
MAAPGNIFVTGGAGFIGSHTALCLLENGYKLTVVDNLDNSFDLAIERVRELAGDKGSNMTFVKADLRDYDTLDRLFGSEKFDAVIHFAGRNRLAKAMRKHGCKNIVFSSSCTVYGNPQYVPIDEKHPLKAVSPYGRTKLIIEDIFRDLAASDPEWNIILLRYFNPVGAHPSGKIGEHQVMLNNLMPWVQAVALGHRPVLNVYGTDYPTRDGTCLEGSKNLGCVPYNLGTGTGTTVLEMVHAFEAASGLKVPLNLTDRRPGDAEAVWAATETAEKELGWKSRLTVKEMCEDQWKWASQNPNGYIV